MSLYTFYYIISSHYMNGNDILNGQHFYGYYNNVYVISNYFFNVNLL